MVEPSIARKTQVVVVNEERCFIGVIDVLDA